MAELYDADGNKVEGYTQAELAAKLKEQQDAEATKQVEKDKNLVKLREQSEQAVKDKEAAEKLVKEKDEALAGKDKEYEQKEIQKERDKKIEALADGDKELKDKITHHVNRFKDEMKTPEDFEKVLSDAYVLASGNQVPDKLQDVISSGGSKGGKGGKGSGKLPISPEAMNVASKMGLTEEDIKKANQ